MERSGEPPVRQSAALVVRSGAREGERFVLEGEETLIGRSPANDITLTDDGVSREHALLCFDAASGAWTVEDLQSTNGTRLNGKRIRSSALQAGDELQIGTTRITFAIG